MPPNNNKKAAAARKKQKELEEKNKLLEARLAQLEGAKSGEKRGTSPTEQAQVAASVKRARTKKGQKGRKSTDSEESEDPLKPTKELIAKAIVEPVFAVIKFAKGPGTTKRLCSCCLRFGSSTKLKKKARKAWGLEFGDTCVGELNKHRSSVQTAVKGVFRAKWSNSALRDIGTLARWEACLTRDLRMTRRQDVADFTFYYSSIMDKATGTPVRWNEYHKGYFCLYNGHPPMKTGELDYYVTPETEAYALTIIKGNWTRWRAQFEAQDKFPQYKIKPIQKAPTAAAIAASNAIKERLYREQNNLADDAALPPNWLATMQLAWEQPADNNNMVRYYV